MNKKRDPKVGTGKKPKGSGRRLYTDENPKDTVSIKFATPADASATVAKVKKINKKSKNSFTFAGLTGVICNNLRTNSRIKGSPFLVTYEKRMLNF